VNALVAKDELRGAMARFHTRSYARGLFVAVVDWGACALVLFLISTHPRWTIALPLSIAQGMLIARAFVLGHDACHGALFPSRAWNRAVGRALFLWTLTPYTLWEFGHNSVHHGYSNLKTRDYVWTPFSPDEWRRLPRWRRALERLYRSPWGFGFYYGLEIWWNRMFFASLFSMSSFRVSYLWDNLLNASFTAAEVAAVWRWAPHDQRWSIIVFGFLLPFAIWNYLMGFAIYCHHTHPDVRWFDSRAEWSFYEAQVCATTHTTFPWGFNWFMHNIFEHTAHHVDTGIPYYALNDAQQRLEQLCGPDIVRVEIFSLRAFRAQMRHCQLYDYRKHRWMRFDEAA